MASRPASPPWHVPLAEYRLAGERLIRLAGAVETNCTTTDLRIEVRDTTLEARHYRPSGSRVRPGVVFFHGGGFVRGSLETHDPLCRALCVRGDLNVVSVAYRLAPEHRFPIAHHDAFDSARWVSEHAERLSIEASALAVAGDSAGGSLAAATALAARRGGLAIKAQGLLYPSLDAMMSSSSVERNRSGPLLTREALAWCYDQYVPDQNDRASPVCSPLLAEDFVGAPPAVIISAEVDPVADDSIRYAAALNAARVPVVAHQYAGMPHNFALLAGIVDDGEAAVNRFATGLAALLN